MSILPKAIYRCNPYQAVNPYQCNPYQDTNGIFQRTRTNNFTFVWKYKKPLIAKAILRKKNGTGGTNLPDFRLYYKPIVIKTS